MAILDLLQLLVVRTQKTKTCFVPPVNTWPTFTAKMDAFDLQRRPVLKSEDSVAVTTQANDISCGRRQTRLTRKSKGGEQHDNGKSCRVLLHLLFFHFFYVTLALLLHVKAEAVALWQLCESTEHPQQHAPPLPPSYPPPSAAGNGTTAVPDPVRD